MPNDTKMSKILVGLDPEFLAKVDKIARAEHRTRSDLLREALRRYADNYNFKNSVNYSMPTSIPAT